MSKTTFDLVRDWAEARNLIAGATPQAQFVKLIEEISEFSIGIDDHNFDEIVDGLGDTVVVLTVLSAQLGTDIESCIAVLDEHLDDMNSFGGALCKSQSVSGLIQTLMNMVGVLATGISKKDQTKVAYGIGAAYRIVEAISFRFDTRIEDNYLSSYNVIKDRKGQMIDGVFVKEADLASYGIAS